MAACLLLLAVAVAAASACGFARAQRPSAAASHASSARRAALPAATPATTPAPAPAPAPPAPSAQPSPPAAFNLAPGGSVGPIYRGQAHGYDASYPQCSSLQIPPGASFGVVGVNGGRAFTVNPCLAAEWKVAPSPRAVYFNSGYKPENSAQTTADCRQRSQYQDAPDQLRTAYAIGCSEAMFSLTAMRTAGITGPAMVWLDVESSNSWDASDLNLNRFALQGEVDVLAALGRLVGIYATFAEWRGIVGGWAPNGVVADWVAGQSVPASCGALGFTGRPVWLAQEIATWGPGGYDSDWAC